MYRYPLVSRNGPQGTPIFGSPVTITAPPSGARLQTVWSAGGGAVYGAAVHASTFELLVLRNGSRWELLESTSLSPLGGWDGSSHSIVVRPLPDTRMAAGGEVTGWIVFGSQRGGFSSRSHNEIDWHRDWRAKGYLPFSGDGIYRAAMELERVGAFEVRSSDGGASKYRSVCTRPCCVHAHASACACMCAHAHAHAHAQAHAHAHAHARAHARAHAPCTCTMHMHHR